jgi:tetratricopeptide (TPR) repeat protein
MLTTDVFCAKCREYIDTVCCCRKYYLGRPPLEHLLRLLRFAVLMYVVLSASLVDSAAAGINKKLVGKPDTPEGNFLELISLETNSDKRLALLDQFTAMFPRSESIGWVYSQLQDAHFNDGHLDKAIQAGDKLLELDPDDLEAARLNLQAAQTKDDKALVKKYTALMESIARRVVTTAAVIDDPDADAVQKKREEIASSVLVQQEYALYDQALKMVDAPKKIKLLDQLLQLNPHTRYLNDVLLSYFLAYKQLNDTSKALAAAEKLLQRDQSHEDVLLFVADYHFRRKDEARRVLDYCDRIVALMNSKRKPAALSDAEWLHQKALYTGMAHYLAGAVQVNEERYDSADRSLRLALSFLKDNNTFLPAALSSLGWANYQLARYSEAVRFYKQCLPFGGVYKEQAEKNLAAIKAEHNVEE